MQQKEAPMAQIAAPVSKRPERKLPHLDLEAVLAWHKANLAAAQDAQAALLDAAEATARLQAGHAQELITRARATIARLQALAA
jgi:hypothetical protein